MAAKPVQPGCTVTADRGVVLALPDTPNAGLLFGAGLLAPQGSVKRVSSGVFEYSSAAAVRVKALDMVTVENGVRALVVGVADGDIAPMAAMKGIYLAVIHLPLQRMANRYKNEIETHYIDGQAVTLVEPGAGLKVANVDGFVKAFNPYNSMFPNAAALERHSLLEFSAQLKLVVDKGIDFITKDVQFKHSGQPGIRSKALMERQGLVTQHHHALAKREDVYGRPLKERFKFVALPPPTDDVGSTTELPRAGATPAPASQEKEIVEPAGAATEAGSCGSEVSPVDTTSTAMVTGPDAPLVAPALPTPAPAVTQPRQPPPPELLTVADGVEEEPPAPAQTTGTEPAAGEQEAEPMDEDDDAPADDERDAEQREEQDLDAEFGPLDEFFRSKPKDRSKQARKKRGAEGVKHANILPGLRRRAILNVPPSPSATPTATPASASAPVSDTEVARGFKGPGTRGGPGKYFTFSKAKEVQQAVKQGKVVSTPDKLKAMAKLGCKDLVSPEHQRLGIESVIALDSYPSKSVSQVSDDAKFEKLKDKYEAMQQECMDLRIKNAEEKAGRKLAEGKASMLDGARVKMEQQHHKVLSKLELQLDKLQRELADSRKEVQEEFERGLNMGIKAASGAK